MRILRYAHKLKLEPWATFDIVEEHEVKDNMPSGFFDRIVAEVMRLNFDYVIVEQPEEILIERKLKDEN